MDAGEYQTFGIGLERQASAKTVGVFAKTPGDMGQCCKIYEQEGLQRKWKAMQVQDEAGFGVLSGKKKRRYL